jgi:NAD(P)-dependent dehydrogenase (short-subunit alcohol dehydrogenase family)
MALAGKRIVVIGGSSGLGFAAATLMRQAGAEVIIAGRTPERLDAARESLGGGVETHPVDICEESQLEGLFAAVGPFDHLFTPGAHAAKGIITELGVEQARAAFDAKFWGQYLAARCAYPSLRPGGSIVFASGVWGIRPPRGVPVPAAINGAVEGLGRALAVDLAPIRVNVLAPGTIDTPLYAGLDPAARAALFQAMAEQLPVGRIGRAEEAAAGVLFLMENEYMTGTVLRVDGGMSLH